MPDEREGQPLRSEAVQDILTKVPHWMILWGNTIILILVALFFAITWFIKYPDIISSEVIITSNTPPQRLYARTTGNIDTILVHDKQNVLPKQTLAMIQNPGNLEDILYLKGIIDTLSIDNGKIDFPVEKIPILSLGDISSSYAVFEKDYIDYGLNKNLNPFSDKIAANKISVTELNLRLENLGNQKKISQKRLEFSKNQLDRNKALYDKGVIALQEYESEQLNFLENQRNLKNISVTISQLKESLNDAYLNSKETRINNEMESTRLFKNAVRSLIQLKESIKTWEQIYLLKSEIKGEVNFMEFWNKNQNVNQGDLIFTIVPVEKGIYEARAKAPARNSGEIKVGQRVNIKLYNYPETEYGMLPGNVKSISAIPDEEGYYIISIALEKQLITSYGIEIPFKNDMSGTAEIITENLRLIERFFYQLKDILKN